MVEVLAAMVIFSAGAALLFTWIGQASARLARISAEQRVLFAELVALEYMKTVNPMQSPTGDVRLIDGVRLRWRAQQLGGGENVLRPGSLYTVGLFQVEVSLELPKQDPRQSSLQLAGWRQVKERSSQGPIQGGGG